MTDDGDITRQLIYDFIVQYKRDNDGLSPTFDEIAEACYISRAGVKYHLPIMQNQGILRVTGRRGITISGGAWVAPDEAEGRDGAHAAHEADPGAGESEPVDDSAAASEQDSAHTAGD